MADSSHIEVEVHTDEISHSKDHHDHSKDKKNAEHCADHEECHNGHYHHFLGSTSSISFSSPNSSPDFLYRFFSYTPNFLEVIKPPLLNS